MDSYHLIRKCLTIGIILLFIGLAGIPSINANNPISDHITSAAYKSNITLNNGTLSGHVTDSEENSIEGARVRVYFHDTYSENYSDSTGYFHVTNISICNCTKNVTCSKEGYYPVWIYLGIWENTTHDFVLTSKGDWLYVGGSGSGNYTRIQNAIDNASSGGTIFVFHGTYNEEILVNKSLFLIGENRNTTIINGSGYDESVYIDGNKINICGFTIQNEGESWIWRRGVFISPSSNRIHIHDNIITKNYIGIDIYDKATDILIYDNVIMKNTNGIYGSGENTFIEIYHNIFSNNDVGIDAEHNFSIYENLISNNSIGILDSAGYLNFIYKNNIRDNKVGLQIKSFIDAQIYQNNFINNNAHISLFRNGLLSDRKSVIALKQNWSMNYWDDLIPLTPRPIPGLMVLAIYVWFGIFNGFLLPIVVHPYFEYDQHPAQEPYDIPGMS
ncbi:Periplasmic copper-binding protein (NosD) [uncultured archaeon]|nr:Periplasmic copper-binding protein (NosD) [uncultured archaeon]